MTLTKLFIIHNENLKCRIPYINSTIQKLKEIKPDLQTTVVKDPSSIYADTIKIKTKLEKTGDEQLDRMLVNINEGHVCNIEKHRNVWKQIEKDDDYAWIIEDDVVISGDYISNVKDFLNTDLSTIVWDIIMTGFSVKSQKLPTKFNKTHEQYKVLPSKASYMIKGKVAKDLLKYTEVYKYPLKGMLSRYIYDNKDSITCLAYHEHLLLEASKIGMVPSSINSNNILIFNPDYGNLVKMINSSDINLKEARNIYKKLEHLGSPDINHMMGVIYHKKDRYDDAKDCFNTAIDLLIEKGGYIGKNSDILNNCINIYKYDQDI